MDGNQPVCFVFVFYKRLIVNGAKFMKFTVKSLVAESRLSNFGNLSLINC